MKASTSGYYRRLSTPVTDTVWDEAHRANTVFDTWKRSRHSLKDDLTLDTDVAVLRAVLDELCLDKVALFGGSSGGARRARRPIRLSRLE
jgi:hypothetical protein